MRAAGQQNMSECLRCKGHGKCGDGAQRLWVPVSSGGNDWNAHSYFRAGMKCVKEAHNMVAYMYKLADDMEKVQ
jgi:hypothetical protein